MIVFTNMKRVWLDGGTGARVKERIDETRAYYPERRWGIFALNFLGFFFRRECLDKVPGFIEGLQGPEDWEFTIALNRHFEFEHLPELGGEFRFRTGLKRVSVCTAATRHKPRNLILYYHGIAPFYSFGFAKNPIRARFLASLSGFLDECPAMIEGLELKKLHDDAEYMFFYDLAKLLQEDGLIREARAAYKYSALLAPYKFKIWRKLARSWVT
jgi:hypothetical protein